MAVTRRTSRDIRSESRLDVLHEGGSVDEPLVVFRHALTHEVVYGSLLDGERRRGHGAVGRALERLYAGRTTEVVELLAYHFARSDDRGPAVDYAIQAGEKLKPVEAELKRVSEVASEIVAELDYLRGREIRLRDTNESTNERVKWFAIGTMGILMALGAWQIVYLRAYFRSKHLI